MTQVFHAATTPAGLLEYRTNPITAFVKAVHPHLYLPLFLRRWAYARGVQRRINGGRWITIGGMQ